MSSTTMLQHYRGADRYMMAAIRKIQERPQPYKVCIQVVPAFCPHSARLNPVANKFMRQAQLPITIYTHADMVNKTAVEWIVQNLHASSSSSSPPTPAFFVNVKDAKNMKRKQLESLRQALLNAALIAGENNMLVTGLPNAGKSSVIYPLTAAAVQASRKKKLYHAAKISVSAGRTAGIKAHRLEVGNHTPRQLIDTPGLLPLPKLLQHDSHLCELWAAGALTGQCMGSKPKEWNTTELAALLLDGLNFHAELSNTTKNKKNEPPAPPPYVASLQLPPAPRSQDDDDSDKETSQWWSSLAPETFVTHLMEHERKQKKSNTSHPHTAVENFLRELRQGMHGGCLIRESSKNTGPLVGRSFYPQRKQNNNNDNNPPPEQDIKVHFVQKENSALVAMNETARLLVKGSLRL